LKYFLAKVPISFLSERIFKPLGMKDTGYNLTKVQQARVVLVHGKSAAGSLISMTSQPRMEGNTFVEWR
jgi:CubicO group peptidase (beta-lactamase class C family)